MKDFEENLINSIQQSITRQVNSTDFVAIRHDDKIKLPPAFLDKAWAGVDQDYLLAQLTARLESELVDRLVNSIAAEIATDIKQLLSVKERREAIRHLARANLDKLVTN